MKIFARQYKIGIIFLVLSLMLGTISIFYANANENIVDDNQKTEQTHDQPELSPTDYEIVQQVPDIETQNPETDSQDVTGSTQEPDSSDTLQDEVALGPYLTPEMLQKIEELQRLDPSPDSEQAAGKKPIMNSDYDSPTLRQYREQIVDQKDSIVLSEEEKIALYRQGHSFEDIDRAVQLLNAQVIQDKLDEMAMQVEHKNNDAVGEPESDRETLLQQIDEQAETIRQERSSSTSETQPEEKAEVK